MRTKPFERIRGRGRAIFVLWLALFSVKEIAKLMGISERTVKRYVTMGSDEYPDIETESFNDEFVTI